MIIKIGVPTGSFHAPNIQGQLNTKLTEIKREQSEMQKKLWENKRVTDAINSQLHFLTTAHRELGNLGYINSVRITIDMLPDEEQLEFQTSLFVGERPNDKDTVNGMNQVREKIDQLATAMKPVLFLLINSPEGEVINYSDNRRSYCSCDVFQNVDDAIEILGTKWINFVRLCEDLDYIPRSDRVKRHTSKLKINDAYEELRRDREIHKPLEIGDRFAEIVVNPRAVARTPSDSNCEKLRMVRANMSSLLTVVRTLEWKEVEVIQYDPTEDETVQIGLEGNKRTYSMS